MASKQTILRNGLSIKGALGNGGSDPLLTRNDTSKVVGKVSAAGGSLSPNLLNSYIFVGNSSNLATGVPVTGDIGVTNAGLVTITDGVIVNSKISPSAGISYSKLSLTNSILDSDINTSAGILRSKIASGTPYRVLVNDASGVVSENASITANQIVISDVNGQLLGATTATYPSLTELSYVKGVSSAIQTQLSNKLAFSSAITPSAGDVITYSGGVWTRFAIGTSGQYLTSTGSALSWSSSPGGLPLAGTTGQYLAKNSNTDLDVGWYTLTTAKITDITASAADLNLMNGAAAAGVTTSNVQSLQGVNSNIQGQLNGKLSTALTQNYLFIGNASNQVGTLAPGTNGYVLTVTAGAPSWQALPSASTPGHTIQNSGSGLTQRLNLNFFNGLLAVDDSGNNATKVSVDVSYNYAWTGTHSWADNNFSIKDNVDPTKIINFQASGLTTATTRTYTWPDVSATIATINGGQTFTSATWNGTVIGSSYGGAGSVNGILKANGFGTVSAAVAGTDYLAGGTAWLLASGGTLSGANTISGSSSNTLKLQFNSLGTTQTDGAGIWLQNATAAANGAQQYPPSIVFEGQAYRVDSSASQTVKILQSATTVQANGTTPTGSMGWGLSSNGSGYANMLNVSGSVSSGAFIMAIGAGSASIQFGGTTSSFPMLIGSNTTNALGLFDSVSGNTKTLSIGSTSSLGKLYVLQQAQSSSWIPAIRIDAGAHTGMTASTEFISHDYRGATQQWATGALTTQRWNYFKGYTATFVGASTLTNAYTVYIDPPVAGTNATITNNYALGVNGAVNFLDKIALAGSFGTAGQVLTSNGSSSAPTWAAGGLISGLTANRIPYASNSTTLVDDSNLTWDNTNKAVTIGTARVHSFKVSGSGFNVFIGNGAGNFTLGANANRNIGIGSNALASLTTAPTDNVAVGENSGTAITTGIRNTLVGSLAGAYITTGQSNIVIGDQNSGERISTGTGNIFIGESVYTSPSSSTNITGNYNINIGYNTAIRSASANGQLVIANIIFGTGNSATGTSVSTGQIGIGVDAPTATLHLAASTTSQASLRIASGTAPTSPNDGDIWYDGTNLKMRVGGTTKTFTLT